MSRSRHGGRVGGRIAQAALRLIIAGILIAGGMALGTILLLPKLVSDIHKMKPR